MTLTPMTVEEKLFCEHWLKSFARLSSSLSDSRFTEDRLLLLIRYEMNTRRRITILDRLFARYFKIRRNRVYTEAIQWMAKHDKSELFVMSVASKDDKTWERGL